MPAASAATCAPISAARRNPNTAPAASSMPASATAAARSTSRPSAATCAFALRTEPGPEAVTRAGFGPTRPVPAYAAHGARSLLTNPVSVNRPSTHLATRTGTSRVTTAHKKATGHDGRWLQNVANYLLYQ